MLNLHWRPLPDWMLSALTKIWDSMEYESLVRSRNLGNPTCIYSQLLKMPQRRYTSYAWHQNRCGIFMICIVTSMILGRILWLVHALHQCTGDCRQATLRPHFLLNQWASQLVMCYGGTSRYCGHPWDPYFKGSFIYICFSVLLRVWDNRKISF